MQSITPAIQSTSGSHLGFVPVYHWRDLTGIEHTHHGRIYRSEAEAMASIHTIKPSSWASWEASIERCATRFEQGPFIRSRKTMAELIAGDFDREVAA